jgi:hypothetical protein
VAHGDASQASGLDDRFEQKEKSRRAGPAALRSLIVNCHEENKPIKQASLTIAIYRPQWAIRQASAADYSQVVSNKGNRKWPM